MKYTRLLLLSIAFFSLAQGALAYGTFFTAPSDIVTFADTTGAGPFCTRITRDGLVGITGPVNQLPISPHGAWGGVNCDGVATTSLLAEFSSSPPGDYTYIYGYSPGNATIADPLYYTYFNWTGSSITPLGNINSTSTSVISFTPENATTTATSSTEFTYHAYINPDDTSNFYSWQYDFSYQKQVAGQLQQNLLDQVVATTTGDFYFTVSLPLEAGNYIVNADIQKRYLGVFLNPFSPTGDFQFHQFVVGTSTYLGDQFQNSIAQTDAELNSRSATSTIAKLSRCNPLGSFDILDCLVGVFIPSPSDVSNLITTFRGTFLRKAPWGYATLAYDDIFGTVSTSTLPTLSYTFASDTPVSGATFNFTPWGDLMGPTSMLETQHPDFVNTATTWFNTIWLIGFGFVLIKEFFGHSGGYSHKNEKEKT